MITCEAHSRTTFEPDVRATFVVAAESTPVGVRITRVLAAQPELSLTATVPVAKMLEDPLPCDLLVVHCQAIAPALASALITLRDAQPAMRIVAVCDSAAARSTRRAVEDAVDGLVLSMHVETALVPTAAAVLAGQTAFPRELRAALRKFALSHREKQVLGLVVMGLTNNEIGGRLYLAESTVKSHLSSAFSKLGVRSRSEAAALILDPEGSLGAGILATVPAVGGREAA